MPSANYRSLIVLLFALLAARLLFILLMPAVYSTDMYSWLTVMDLLEQGKNPYIETGVLNWPPFWMQICFVLKKISNHTGIQPTHLIQSTLIAAEACVVAVVWYLGGRFLQNSKQVFRALLLGWALNPICIFLSCQHANFDVFVGLWVLIAAGCLMSFVQSKKPEEWLAACFFIGLGILTKTVPIILCPLLLINIRQLSNTTRIFGLILLGAPFLIGMSVLYSLAQYGVKDHVLNYRSMGGWYGFSGLAGILNVDAISFAIPKISPFLFSLLMGFAAWLSAKERTATVQKVLLSFLILLVFVPTFGPGYSPPYILWFLPLLILWYVAADAGFRKFLFIGWIICILTYAFEYSLYPSHGAFLTQWIKTPGMLEISDAAGGRRNQTLARLPMFLFYLLLWGKLIHQYLMLEKNGSNSKFDGRVSDFQIRG
jgi:hypothetical protein